MKFFSITVLMLLPLCAFGQQSTQSEEEKAEKQLLEAIDKQVEDMSRTLELAPWQEFYVDSILTHDFHEMQDEFKKLSDSKVSNSDAYSRVQDKWMEKIYQAFHKVLEESQWEKYNKSGAAREKKARDKREAKRND